MIEDQLVYVVIPKNFKGDEKNEERLAKELCVKEGATDIKVIDKFFDEDIPEVQNKKLWKTGMIISQLADADYAYFADGWKTDSESVFIYNICKTYNIKIVRE